MARRKRNVQVTQSCLLTNSTILSFPPFPMCAFVAHGTCSKKEKKGCASTQRSTDRFNSRISDYQEVIQWQKPKFWRQLANLINPQTQFFHCPRRYISIPLEGFRKPQKSFKVRDLVSTKSKVTQPVARRRGKYETR